MFKSKYRFIMILSLIFLNTGCDQISKKVVRSSIAPKEIINVFDDYFILTKVENTGAFLSLFAEGDGWIRLFFLNGLPLIALVFGVFYLYKYTSIDKLSVLGLCFIIGGGVGNIIDRILYGSVTDFMFIDLGFVRTGVFNIADVSIVIGVIFLAIHSIKAQFFSQNSV